MLPSSSHRSHECFKKRERQQRRRLIDGKEMQLRMSVYRRNMVIMFAGMVGLAFSASIPLAVIPAAPSVDVASGLAHNWLSPPHMPGTAKMTSRPGREALPADCGECMARALLVVSSLKPASVILRHHHRLQKRQADSGHNTLRFSDHSSQANS